jgi:hypothetical protein
VSHQARAEIRRSRWGYTIQLHDGLVEWSNRPWRLTYAGAVRKAQAMLAKDRRDGIGNRPIAVIFQPGVVVEQEYEAFPPPPNDGVTFVP